MQNERIFIKWIFFLTIVATLQGCTSEETKETSINKDAAILKIDVKDSVQLKYSDSFGSMKLIKLQTTNNSLLGKVGKVLTYHDKIVIVNDGKNQSVAVFDRSGNFVNEINRKGNGVGEYVNIDDALIDSTNNSIEILDRSSKKIIRYNLDTYDFTDEIFIDNLASAFYRTGDLYELYCGHAINKSQSRLIFRSAEGENVSLFLKQESNKSRYMVFFDIVNFSMYDNKLSFCHSFNDTIYDISSAQFQARYILNFGEQQMPREFLNRQYKDVMDFYNECVKSSYVYKMNGIFETSAFILFPFNFKDKTYVAKLNKKDLTVTVVSSIADDMMLPGSSFETEYSNLPRGTNQAKNEMYFVIEPKTLLDRIEKLKYSMTARNWESFVERNELLSSAEFLNLSIYDNPIIVIAKPL